MLKSKTFSRILLFVLILSLTAIPAGLVQGSAAAEKGAAWTPGETVASVGCEDATWSENARGTGEYTVTVPAAGEYMLLLTYQAINDAVEAIECQITVHDRSASVTLSQSYVYDQYPFLTDERDDEVRPKLIKEKNLMSMPAYDSDGSSACPLLFAFQQGDNTIQVQSIGGSVSIKEIAVVQPVAVPSYTEYQQYTPTVKNYYQTLEAENVSRLSDRTLQLQSLAEAGLSPETYGRRVYNTLGGKSWKYPGQWLEWELYAPEDGVYQVAFKYIQNVNNSLHAYRRVEIDGQVPFVEMLCVPFEYTTSWTNKVLGDNEPYLFYLTKGSHTLRMTSVNEPYYELYEALLEVAAEVKALDIQVKGATGLLADTQVDAYKIYQLQKYIPDISQQLTALSESIAFRLNQLCALTGMTPDKFDVLRYESRNLLNFAEDPDLITKSFDALTRVQTNITSFAVTLTDQPLMLDTVMLKSPDGTFGQAGPGLWGQFVYFIKQLIASFTDDHGNTQVVTGQAVEVWTQRNRDYVNLMQQYANEYFTPQTGLTVNVNYIPGQDILILANSAGMQPAVVTGISRDVPFNFALRNAILPLDEFDGYETLRANVTPGAMIPYRFSGHEYALPEEVIFNVLFYRQDIFDDYNLTVPHTWEDAQRMVPTLQQNNMNFWLAWGDWLTFYYQFGTDAYTPNGLDLTLDSEEGYAVFKYWSELYTKYNFPQRIGSFYQNFRYGYIPVGVSSLQDYFLLKLAAPELSGTWRIAPIPGIVNNDGVNVRWESGDERGVMLFKTDARREAEGWAFIQWWLDTETQTNYALDLESAFGQEFRWFSANPEVVRHIPWDENDKKVILTQMQWFKGIPYSPGGSYLLEREMKNALSEVVIDKKNYRDSLEKASQGIRKEMIKTQREFGFTDENGNVLRQLDMLDVPLPAND